MGSDKFFKFNEVDKLFDHLTKGSLGYRKEFDKILNRVPSDNYPPINIIDHDNGELELQLAVAGFDNTELSVKVEDRDLVIGGQKNNDEGGPHYRHRGISFRNFERRYRLGEFHKVSGSVLKNGILTVVVVEEIPEEKLPVDIPILNADLDLDTSPKELLNG
jgi:molecular chaperone IbpA